jgi:hypothetical protein
MSPWVWFEIDYPGRLAIVACGLIAYWILVVLMRRAIARRWP